MTGEERRAALRYVDTPEALGELVSVLAEGRVPEVAVDTEADSLHSYFEKLCLIQITLGEVDYVVDPLRLADLEPLRRALEPRHLIFHGADYDLRMLAAGMDFDPKGEVFDTMLAAQLLGYEQIGMAALVEKFFGVELPKKYQRYDWSKRPLPGEVLEYARNDTRFLPDIVAHLREELRDKGRLEWHRQACARAVASARDHEPSSAADPWRIKGAGKLKGGQLAMLRELWQWRDAEARRSDRPPFKVLGNRQLLELAEWAVEHPRDSLAKGPKLPRNCVRRRLDALEKAVARGRTMPREQWPARRRPPGEERSDYRYAVRDSEALIAALQKARDTVAGPLELAGSILAPRAALESIACCDARDAESARLAADLMPWQVELLWPVFEPVMRRADILRCKKAEDDA